MRIEAKQEFEELSRNATACRDGFTRGEVLSPFIDVAQPRWVGPKSWDDPFCVASLMLNPGQSRRDSGAKEFLRLIRAFRAGSIELRSILDGQRDSMKLWGNPSGRFTGFYIDGLCLDFDDIAFASVAWCATAKNRYPVTMLDRCFARHTGPLLRILRPTVVLASGSRTHTFANQISAILPGATVIKIMHYAHREGRAAEHRELTRVRLALKTARAQCKQAG